MSTTEKTKSTAQGADLSNTSVNEEKLTSVEFNTLNSLNDFLNCAGIGSTNPDYSAEEFCFKSYDLFNGLNDFICGRFHEDSGPHHLQHIFMDAINAKPHMAAKYFYAYSELMNMLTALYSNKDTVRDLAETFTRYVEKVEFFEPAKTVKEPPYLLHH